VCLCIPSSQLLNASTNLYETWVCIAVPLPPGKNQFAVKINKISWKLSPSQRRTSYIPSISLCVYMCILPIVARQRLGKHVPSATSTCNNTRIIERIIFCAVRFLSKESLLVSLCIPVLLLGNNSVNKFPRQRTIVGGVVFYGSMSYQRQVGVLFFSELLVLFLKAYETVIVLYEQRVYEH
jgi:hypothetical protein